MHMRRILLAFSFAASAASVAFADLVELNTNNASSDRIEQLTRTLSEGAYTESNDIDVPAETDIFQAYKLLEAGEEVDLWEFEEGKCAHKIEA